MSLMIQNRMQRPFTFPEVAIAGVIAAQAITLEPGDAKPIERDHFDAVRSANGKGNPVIEALLAQRHLVVTEAAKVDRVEHTDQLANTDTPEPPVELRSTLEGDEVKAETEGAKLAGKVEVVDLTPEEPAEAKAPKRGRA